VEADRLGAEDKKVFAASKGSLLRDGEGCVVDQAGRAKTSRNDSNDGTTDRFDPLERLGMYQGCIVDRIDWS
jgi:hypothetical protein